MEEGSSNRLRRRREREVWTNVHLTPPTECESTSDETGADPAGASTWMLDFIHIENFKSYKNRTSIGPLQRFPFIAIIGPNGSGKSNLMDAISFVMGERTTSLRCKRLDELIHGASIGKPASNTASVSAVFTRINDDNHNKDVTFTRVIRGAGSEYLVNDNVVSQQAYFDELKKLGINAKGKNFLVFQGAIETIALKNAKERTVLFEEICGSVAIKNEYEQAKNKVIETEKKMEASYLKKKSILVERREVKMALEEERCYNELLEEKAEKETEFALFNLKYVEKENLRLVTDHSTTESRVQRLLNGKERLLGELNKNKKQNADLSRKLALKETELRKVEKEKSRKMPECIEVKPKRKHLEKSLKSAESSLKQAEDNKKNHEKDVAELQEKLEEAKKNLESFLELHRDTQEGAGVNVTLQRSQLTEYFDLKQEVYDKTNDEHDEMLKLELEKKSRNDVLNSLDRDRRALQCKVDVAKHELRAERNMAQIATDTIAKLEEEKKTKESDYHPLKNQIKEAKEKIIRLENELPELLKEMDNEKTNRFEAKRQHEKQTTLRSLKDYFPGVYDRVIELCKPIHSKYQIAITKAMGDSMDHIVVDTEKTAKQCIQYLKDRMLAPESFLPLDFLEVKPLRTRFRELKSNNVFLAYDLLELRNKEVEKAILHCTGSIVVCPSDHIAESIAAGEFLGGEKTKAVSLNGVMFQPNGVISAGKLNLQKKAVKWNDQQMRQKEERRDQIYDELREAMKLKREEFNASRLEQDINCVQKRLEFAQQTLKYHNDKILTVGEDLEKFEAELDELMVRLQAAEQRVMETTALIKACKLKINAVQDKVFADFCRKIDLPNIRAYEEVDVRTLMEFRRGKEEHEKRVQQLQVQLDDETEQQRPLDANIKRWEAAVKEIRGNLLNCKSEEEKIQKEMQQILDKMSEIQAEIKELNEMMDSKSKDIKKVHQDLGAKEKLILNGQKELAHLEVSLAQVKSQRHEIYKKCKLEGIALPFLRGSIDDIQIITTSSDNSSVDPTIIEENIELDFSKLAEELLILEGDAIKKSKQQLRKELDDIENKIESFHGTNMKTSERWEVINQKQREYQAEFDEIRTENKDAQKAFHDVKRKRYGKFKEFFDNVSQSIDQIYKDLTQNDSAQALLGLENDDEPYLDGVTYHCVAPGKRFQSMDNLSGGEKTLAALALLFAIQSYEPAPFFVLDEIDAALDNTNIEKVTSYVRRKSRNLQLLVISLKEEMFATADGLIGIAPKIQRSECIESNVYSLDLGPYLEA